MGTAITVKNSADQTLYLYNDDFTSSAPVSAVVLESQATTTIPMLTGDQKRLYVAAEPLKGSLEKGVKPDAFNPTNDAGVEYSFFEYAYEPQNNRFTADLSYIDEFSFPLTLNFANLGTYKGAQSGFEYGFNDLDPVIGNLNSRATAAQPWGSLVWPEDPVTAWAPNPAYPDGLRRIVGPNKVWTQQRGTTNPVAPNYPGIGPWEPQSFYPFVMALPESGTQLFQSVTNWNGWQNGLNPKMPAPLPTIDPGTTGYGQALRAAATPDASGKYGFFTFPNDNRQGEFTYVPDTASLRLTVQGLS
ncbi:beta-1,3-glucanase family protein [Synechococcus sp. CS-1328]|uniref:beta-1,3-glucanase family protein n=1 Tax=Synechococcus sp. CS-1328 TaxID=2847976 RepID=UPI00223BCF30|nr:beta-1,3-glucanase family protein [Synechococcus sp. CS-1328]MCT0224070.1 hypothetical protein [Synechococcus sp. CS-1328]